MKHWSTANRHLVAKAIAEMSYEQVFVPAEIGPGEYRLDLANGASYLFKAWRTVWDFLRIDAQSVRREPEIPLRADQFYRDSQTEHGMSDITLAAFLEETYRTLYSDQKTLELQSSNAGESWFESLDVERQSLLDGHPKALANKGRIGWSTHDLAAYAPESTESLRLYWLAVEHDCLVESFADKLDSEGLIHAAMTNEAAQELFRALETAGCSLRTHAILPVHPWQWHEVIPFHFQDYLSDGRMIMLGRGGDSYRPQTSLRTLTNMDHPQKLQMKLPVSILNTSCVRGIAGATIPIAPAVTETLQKIVKQDPCLEQVVILGDVAGQFVKHPHYEALQEAPYRYKEFLGAIWRESPESHLAEGETSLLTAALFHRQAGETTILSQVIARSGLTPAAWIQAYAETVVVPLYHLQVKYGIGLVAHGQNIMLTLKEWRPHRVMIKDFQGDLRLVSDPYPELSPWPADLKAALTRLPATYLIHDLITGHFVTVLRFVSAGLSEDKTMSETAFYEAVAGAIKTYHQRVPEYRERYEALGLLGPFLARVLVNRVRFKIGYGETNERPVPVLGTELLNPLYEEPHEADS